VDNPNQNPIWPVDLDAVRLWPMEGEDGPLLQELFDDLSDFRTAFGEPGAADAVGRFINLPEGVGYDSKLLIGIWKNGGLAGALDCIIGYPSSDDWTVGLLVIADRYRLWDVGSSVVRWLETEAVDRGSSTVADWFVQPMQEASTLRGAANIQFTTFPTSPTISWPQSHFDTSPAAYGPHNCPLRLSDEEMLRVASIPRVVLRGKRPPAPGPLLGRSSIR
jgi:hypothetical protein